MPFAPPTACRRRRGPGRRWACRRSARTSAAAVRPRLRPNTEVPEAPALVAACGKPQGPPCRLTRRQHGRDDGSTPVTRRCHPGSLTVRRSPGRSCGPTAPRASVSGRVGSWRPDPPRGSPGSPWCPTPSRPDSSSRDEGEGTEKGTEKGRGRGGDSTPGVAGQPRTAAPADVPACSSIVSGPTAEGCGVGHRRAPPGGSRERRYRREARRYRHVLTPARCRPRVAA